MNRDINNTPNMIDPDEQKFMQAIQDSDGTRAKYQLSIKDYLLLKKAENRNKKFTAPSKTKEKKSDYSDIAMNNEES